MKKKKKELSQQWEEQKGDGWETKHYQLFQHLECY